MKLSIKSSLLLVISFLLGPLRLSAQTVPAYSLQQLIDSAVINSELLSIRQYQVQEKISRLKEDHIKRYPSATVDGSYQYNFSLPDIVIPAGTIGSVQTGTGTTQLLPSQASRFSIGSKSTYNVGVNIYQPIAEQLKINTAIAIGKTDIMLAEQQKEKTLLQLVLAVEQLYYGALIFQKQIETARMKLELEKARLYDAEGALTAGTTTGVNITGLRAAVANQEQNVLKFDIQMQDYLAELSRFTGLDVAILKPGDILTDHAGFNSIDEYKNTSLNSPEMQIARFEKEKAQLAVKAARQNSIPSLGLMGGYYVQGGNPVLPGSSPFVGASLKWNIQDLFSNKQVQNQRQFQLSQAEQNTLYIQRQLDSQIDKAWRKVKQSQALIAAAQKLVGYRTDALKEQQDKQLSGRDIKTALLETKSQLAEAQADLYAAQMSNVLAIRELKNLSGQVK